MDKFNTYSLSGVTTLVSDLNMSYDRLTEVKYYLLKVLTREKLVNLTTPYRINEIK